MGMKRRGSRLGHDARSSGVGGGGVRPAAAWLQRRKREQRIREGLDGKESDAWADCLGLA
jgi:hypothetical protein